MKYSYLLLTTMLTLASALPRPLHIESRDINASQDRVGLTVERHILARALVRDPRAGKRPDEIYGSSDDGYDYNRGQWQEGFDPERGRYADDLMMDDTPQPPPNRRPQGQSGNKNSKTTSMTFQWSNKKPGN